MSINRVVISGNLTRDPEIRQTQSGMNILTFGMAVNDRRRNPQSGEWEDYANFVDCVLFGNRADFLSRTLHKGIRVVVEGKLRYSSWEKDGQRRSKLEVVVDDVDFVTPRQQQGQGPYDGGFQQRTVQGGYQQQQQSQPTYSAPQQGYQQMPPSQQQAAPAPQQGYQQASAPAESAPAPQAPAPRPVVSAPPTTDVYDEDIPF